MAIGPLGPIGGAGVQNHHQLSQQVSVGDDTVRIFRKAAGILGIKDAAQFAEIADPSAPAANNAVIYSKDNGSSKTQLVVRFPTGAVQVLTTEP